MADVRRLTLMDSGFSRVDGVPQETFKLGLERLDWLKKVLPELDALGYWSPQYSAWEPFLFSYLRSGIIPELASKWLPRLAEKIEVFKPPENDRSAMFAEIIKYYKINSQEMFKDYRWDDIEDFVSWSPTIIDNYREIISFIFNTDRCNKILSSLLNVKDEETNLSPNLPYVVYMYRHLDNKSAVSASIVTEIKAQLQIYIKLFTESFDSVASFIGEKLDVYTWYTPKVKDLIVHAWETSLDNSRSRDLVTPKDVFSMPVWLSEQVTDYLNTLPCTYTEPQKETYVFDAVLYSLYAKDLSQRDIIYASCLAKSTVKSMISRLSTFYWDVKENRFVQTLIDMVDAKHTISGFDPNTKTASEYAEELRRRGFPVPGGV